MYLGCVLPLGFHGWGELDVAEVGRRAAAWGMSPQTGGSFPDSCLEEVDPTFDGWVLLASRILESRPFVERPRVRFGGTDSRDRADEEWRTG